MPVPDPATLAYGHAVAVAVGARRDADVVLSELGRWPPAVFLDAGLLARQCHLPLSRARAALERLASAGALERGRRREPRTYRLYARAGAAFTRS
jgi:hypothetical protein